MKIILAQLRKDLVSARALFLGWAICLAIECLFSLGQQSFLRSQVEHKSVGIFAVAIMGLTTGVLAGLALQLVLILLVVRVIHDDPLTEPNAFWRTRPIPRPALLAEKVLLISLLLLADWLSALAAGVRFGNMTDSSWILHLLEFVTGLAAFAAVTSTLAQLILNALVIAVASRLTAAMLLNLLSRLVYPAQSLTAGSGPWFGHPAAWEISLLYTTGFVLVLVWQYLTLRTTAARGILCAIFLVAALWQA